MTLRVRRSFRAILGYALIVGMLVLPAAGAQTLPGSWERLADAPTIRTEASYVNLNGQLHLVGGIKAHHVYDPATNSWSTKAPMPVKLNHVQAVALGGKIYVVGGLTSWPDGDVNTVYMYDPGTNAWTQGAHMPVGRGAGATVVHNGKIYYAGGLHGGVAVPLFDVYDPSTNSWSSLPNMPRVREHFHAAVVNGKVWAIGGRNVSVNSTISQTDAFNFATGQWEAGYAPIPTKRGGFGVGVSGNEVIVFGGEGGGIAHPEVEAYDTVTNTWRQLASMPVPRHGIQVAECNGAYYIATGSTDQGGGSSSAYQDVFRLSSGTGCGDGGGGGTVPIGFGVSSLSGATGSSPTTLAWGPDGRLYVGYMFGVIRAYSVVRDSANSYRVTSTETINAVANIPNRNDGGQVNTSVTGRLLLGIAVTGSASNPVIYATSSDPRIGGGAEGTDLNLDTNSGTLSRLSWTGSSWQHTILVQGLPRSEENHGPNGIALSSNGQTLYWAYGGHTNKGGPSNNFANLPEYAYSAAILSVDLGAIGSTTYTMPTLDDPSRGPASGPNQNDVNDPFGGNDGVNQARITAGSPVQVFAPGFRNPYDLVIATTGNHAGKMYVPDNGPNGGWGDTPVGEGTPNCTNQTVAQAETGANDALHLVTPGYYGGHANPTRGNANNTFNGQSPVLSSNPVECDFRSSKTSETTSISLLPNSSDGIAEYTTGNFGGAMTGNLLIASYQARKVVRIVLNSAGSAVTLREDNFATFSTGRPLDVVTMGSGQAFPGTIWIADIAANTIHVMEPNDFGGGGGGGGGGGCTGQDTISLDEDEDGYSNADEIDNGTNPCSAASAPPDHDTDGVSDLNDPDDDNDGLADVNDAFAIDPTNGTTTNLPIVVSWENDQAPPGGIANTGFTGLMTNGTTNYLNQFDENGMVVGGAAGVFTVAEVPAGDAGGAKNSQMYGFQLGVDPPSTKFQVVGRIVDPFSGISPGASQQMGIFLGDGTQDGYVKLVLKGNDTSVEDVHLRQENLGATVLKRNKDIVLPGPDFVDLRLVVDPSAGTVQGFASASNGGVQQPQIVMGNPVPIPANWLNATGRGLAVGVISTSAGPAPPFPATWDFFHVEPV